MTEVYSQTKKPNHVTKSVKKKTVIVPIQPKISPAIFKSTPGGAEVKADGEYINRVLGFRYKVPKPYKPFLPTVNPLQDFTSFVNLTDDKTSQISMSGNRLQFCSSTEEYADREEKYLSEKMDGFELVEKSKTQVSGMKAVRLVHKSKRGGTETAIRDIFYICRPMENSSNTYQFTINTSPEFYEKYKKVFEQIIATVKFEKSTK